MEEEQELIREEENGLDHLEDLHDQENIKPKKQGKIINIISNIVFIPVMVILIFYLIYAINVQKENGIPSFFGQSYVRVLSGSMRKSGFERGDVVVIERINISKIKAADENEKNGSIIAFYNSSIKQNSDGIKAKFHTEIQENTQDFKSGQKTYKNAIMFHQVIGIYYDDAGNTWFETKGTSNNYPDSTLVRGDYVVGHYVDSFMADVTDIEDVTLGDEVVIWDNENITVEDLAKCCDTINYEILCSISDRVPRKFINE